ncbi:hypothetical protein J5X84_03860 [Streptosporangiaceae bacterium NEAU-GS5]|nr:hypothetical protein [Streptosporangiaceae bacterium NEAU-GS5]
MTARPRPEVNTDFDMPMLHEAFAGEQATAVVASWDDPDIDWAGFDLVVIRSPWDYSWRSTEFLAWVDRVSKLTRLANPPEIIYWNARKEYLQELGAVGVPVIPTTYLAPGDAIELPTDHEYVVKPAIGAGARFTARYAPDEAEQAAEHIRRVHAEGVIVMIQPYLTRIDVTGERALVFVKGEFLHAIRKRAVLSPGLRYDQPRDAHPGTEPWEPVQAELDLAKKALAAVPDSASLLYARVDMADNFDGAPVMTELELIEPGLYLRFHKGNIPSFVAAIIREARSVSSAYECT